jgi:parallel beta-helix repeat protein
MPRFTGGFGRWLGVLLVCGGGTWAFAQDLHCGDTLGPGGVFTLQADLVCDTNPGLTVRDQAVLDLGGHHVVGSTPAILLTGRGAVLQNGAVDANELAVQVAGEGRHTVRGLQATGDSAGILVTSDANRVSDTIGQSLYAGLTVQGHRNILQRTLGGGQGGFDLSGDENLLVQSRASGLPAFGVRVQGHRNVLRANEVLQNGQGITVQGSENTIVGNTARGNRLDLVDAQADCDDNRWAHNVFETSQAGTTVNPACIQ